MTCYQVQYLGDRLEDIHEYTLLHETSSTSSDIII